MAVQTIKRSVTSTRIKSAKIDYVDGKSQSVDLPDEVVIGNVKKEKAQKLIAEKHGDRAVLMELKTDTHEYEMPVKDFIEVASVVEPQEEE